MNFEFFLAQRMRISTPNESTVSGRIIKIAILAIALGMIMMLIAMGTSFGLQREIKAKTIALSGHLRIAPFENNNSKISVTPIGRDEVMPVVEYFSIAVQQVYPYITRGALLKTKDEFEGAVIKGVDIDFPWDKLSVYRVQGEYPLYDSLLTSKMVLSEKMARKLSLTIGDRVRAYFQNEESSRLPRMRYFELAATYQTGFPDFDDNFVFVDLRHLQRINQWDINQVGGYELFVDDHDNMGDIANKIYDRLPPHIDIQTVGELYASIFDWIALFDFNVLVILIVMILVGTLNMATALLVLILERSRMIGVLKALGATQNQVQKVFLFNAAYIIGKGLLWGNSIGLALLFIQKKGEFVQLDSATYFVTAVPVYLRFWDVAGLNILVFCSCLLLLWIPSTVIGKIDPTRVLRFR